MSGKRSAILRAEVLRGESAEVTCALEMTAESVFVVASDLPLIGDVLTLRLSFPRAVQPILVRARVRQVRFSSGPGTLSGFIADFEIDTAEQRAQLTALAARLNAPLAPASIERALAILLVEDSKLIRDMFVYTVERYFGPRSRKVTVVQAATVADAWSELERKRDFDVAVVDHFLPDATGASFVKGLRGDAALRRMPVVAMSVGGPEARAAMFNAGADLFLQKPIVLKDLFCTFELLVAIESGGKRGAA